MASSSSASYNSPNHELDASNLGNVPPEVPNTFLPPAFVFPLPPLVFPPEAREAQPWEEEDEDEEDYDSEDLREKAKEGAEEKAFHAFMGEFPRWRGFRSSSDFNTEKSNSQSGSDSETKESSLGYDSPWEGSGDDSDAYRPPSP